MRLGAISLTIEGMSCSHCAATVSQAVRAVPGVAEVSVDFSSGHATVEPCNEGPDVAGLLAAVAAAGYRVTACHIERAA